MNRKEKAELIETLQSTFNASTTVVVAHQVGMTVAESSELRARMREAGAGFKVTKNRLTKIALQGTKYEEMKEMFSGPTAMGTSPDPVGADVGFNYSPATKLARLSQAPAAKLARVIKARAVQLQ